jgi:hypothetical protein
VTHCVHDERMHDELSRGWAAFDQRPGPAGESTVIFVASSRRRFDVWCGLFVETVDDIVAHDVIDDRITVLGQECTHHCRIDVCGEVLRDHDCIVCATRFES